MKLGFIHNYMEPYHAIIYDGCNLSPHKHYDIEIIYSKKGSVYFTIDRKKYDLHPNQMIIINSLATHSSVSDYPETKMDILLLKIGHAFLRNAFPAFSEITLDNPIVDLSDNDNEWQKKTKAVLEGIYNNLQNPGITPELMLQSNLYRLCAYIMELYQNNEHTDSSLYRSYVTIKKIEDIVQYVFDNYHEDITVEEAAKMSGYTKEYFCKVFRQISGETFHSFLSRVRIEQAKFLLSNTTMSISEIAVTVGIKEHKTFCAIFKNFTKNTPTEYRKKQT